MSPSARCTEFPRSRSCSLRAAGKYRIRFFYSTASDLITEWAGDHLHGVDNELRLTELLRLVPKVDVSSNEVVVEVVAPGEPR